MAPALRKRITALALVIAVVSVVMLVLDARRIADANRFNTLLTEGRYTNAGETPSPYGQVARAYGFHYRLRLEDALQTYLDTHTVGNSSDASLAAVIKFNLATLYLQQATRIDAPSADVVAPLIELAKEGYRDLLRVDPSHWDARFNLELALTLQPDPLDIEAEQTVTPERTPRAPRVPLGYGGLP